jgi:hypothetical protein
MAKKFEITETPENICPYCGYKTTHAGSLDGHAPSETDISVCVKCYNIVFFDAGLKMRKPTVEEFAELRSDPEMWRDIEKLRFVLKKTSLPADYGKD